MRQPIIAGNWKMHGSVSAAESLCQALNDGGAGAAPVSVVVCPPAPYLQAVSRIIAGTGMHLGAQHIHWEASGAFTGEVSPTMLIDLGVGYCIVGHSERRQLFGELDEEVARKTAALLEHDVVPIVCVGETLSERESDQTLAVIERQLKGALSALTADQATKLVLAYEPVWAIGTGHTATPEQAQEVHARIREWVAAQWDGAVAEGVQIQYGGSVKAGNAQELLEQPDIDGALVGGASLDAESFLAIVQAGTHVMAEAT